VNRSRRVYELRKDGSKSSYGQASRLAVGQHDIIDWAPRESLFHDRGTLESLERVLHAEGLLWWNDQSCRSCHTSILGLTRK
jgi:hypothetical protein